MSNLLQPEPTHISLSLFTFFSRPFYSALLLTVLLTFSVPVLDLGQASLWSASVVEWKLISKHQECENMILLETVGAGGGGDEFLCTFLKVSWSLPVRLWVTQTASQSPHSHDARQQGSQTEKGAIVSRESEHLFLPPHLGEGQIITKRKQYLPTAHFTLSLCAENNFSKKAPFIGLTFPISVLITN